MNDIDEDMIRKASEGDVSSFEAIYKATSGFVYNVALRMINHREDAQEITQEVFLNVHRQLKNFRFESSFKTWVYRITVNYALNYGKKESKRKSRMTSYDEQYIEQQISTGSTDEERADAQQHITKTLDSLNSDQRACVILRNMEGLSYQQIADALEININTVRSRLKRARETMLVLRKKVAHE